jgi:hypothetical protein
MLAADQLRQLCCLLPVVAPAPDLVDAQVRMRAIAQADRGRSARNLFAGDNMFEVAEPEATPLLIDRNTMQPHRAHATMAGHSSSRGNQSSASIRWVSGVICSRAKRDVASRIISALSPRTKSKMGAVIENLLIFVVVLPEQVSPA